MPNAQEVDLLHRPGISGSSCTDRGALNATATFPGAGYYSSVTQLPSAWKILPGTTVLGVAGTAHASSLTNAFISRATTASDITYEGLHSAGTCDVSGHTSRQRCESNGGVWTPSDLDNNVYERPTVSSSNWATATAVNRAGFVDCGTSGTIEARIADCASTSKNGVNATWPTTTSLEFPWGTWKLVSRNGANREVWRDEATYNLWSSDVALANVTWCRYTGNQENAGGVDCSANTQSVCYEDGVLTSPVAGENFAAGTYSAAKGGMGRNSATPVRWRPMTVHDWQSAYSRGLYYVLPTAANMWTSTLYPGLPAQAYFVVSGIYTNPGARTGSNRAFCIGR